MTRAIALAKISRPRLFGVVPRVRLFDRLEAAMEKPLVWVWGPPGSGKTSLVASFLAHKRAAGIWYQADAGDADPATLFHYLSLAAPAARGRRGLPLPRYSADHGRDVAAFGRLYFRALFARLAIGAHVVVDNYQEVSTDAPFHDILRVAVEELPAGISLIVISRAEAPLAYARVVAGNALSGIDWEQLRLTLDEVRALARHRKIDDDRFLRDLHQRSQGWAAGVMLMMEGAVDSDGVRVSPVMHSREAMFQYFASLIFDQASEREREALLALCHAPQVTSSMAIALTGWARAPQLLEDLHQRRMFTDRRPGAERIYQFHALFREFLRDRAVRTLPAESVAQQVARTAAMLEESADVDAAAALWSEIGDWGAAGRVLIANAAALMREARWQTLALRIAAIPAAFRATQPWLSYWLGCAQLQTEPAQGMNALESSLQRFSEHGDRTGRLECLIALLRGVFAGFHALDAMDRWLDDLLYETEQDASFASLDLELRVWSALCVTLFHVRPWHPSTLPAYRKTAALLPRCEDPHTRLGAAIATLTVSGLSGNYELGEEIIAATDAEASNPRALPGEAAWWWGQVGYLRFMQTRYEEALACLEQGERLADANAQVGVREVLLLWQALVEYRSQGWTTASVALARFESLETSVRPMIVATRDLFRSRRAAQLGNHEEATALARSSERAAMRSGSRLEELIYRISVSDVYADTGRVQDAAAALVPAQVLVSRSPAYEAWGAVMPWMDAWLHHARGERSAAAGKLREALACAHVEVKRHFLRFAERSLVPLCCLALEECIEEAIVLDLIRIFRLKPPASAPDNWPWPVRIFTLGCFEVQADGAPIEFSRKLPRKTLMLLKAIVALGGRNVPESLLCDALWGNEEGDAAHNAYAITVLRLRKLLGNDDAVLMQGGTVSLHPAVVWIDSDAFERGVMDPRLDIARVLELYQGVFLPEDQDQPWSVASRERLRGKYIHALSDRGTDLEQRGDVPSAMQCYLRGIDTDPIVEVFSQGLMRCYENLGRRSEAFSVYRRLQQVLSVVLGVPPSEASRRLYKDMLARQAKEVGPGAHAGPAAPQHSTMDVRQSHFDTHPLAPEVESMGHDLGQRSSKDNVPGS